jgi:hypothetical protein
MENNKIPSRIPCQFFESYVIRAFQEGMIIDIGAVSQRQHITACFNPISIKPGAGFGRRDVPALISIKGRTPDVHHPRAQRQWGRI